jgi:hypothetical protein
MGRQKLTKAGGVYVADVDVYPVGEKGLGYTTADAPGARGYRGHLARLKGGDRTVRLHGNFRDAQDPDSGAYWHRGGVRTNEIYPVQG